MTEKPAIPVTPNSYTKLGVFVVVAFAIVLGGLTSFYTVESEEQAVVLRFGKYHSITEPGLHFKIPLGVDRAIKVATKRQLKEEFGYRTRTVRQGNPTRYDNGDFPEESLMVTGDLNAAEVEWSVQYRIQDPRAFLFNVREPVATMRDASESVMRQVVGDRTVDEVITVGRQDIQDQTEVRLQKLMDEYQMGLKIEKVVLQDVSPPSPVAPSFNAVNEAQQHRERMINEARSKYNQVVPRARGEALQLIQAAEGYATERVNRSQGDASRFDSMLVEYLKAPEITRRRMYLETMQKILPSMGRKVIVDQNAQSVLPLLQLNENTNGKGNQ